MKDINVSELSFRLKKGESLNFIDVREEWEHEEANIGAQLIPLSTIPDRISNISDSKSDEIIVHCKSGNRSNQAKIYLRTQGYSNVRSLLGGLERYLKEQ